jgi:hypothetical protein
VRYRVPCANCGDVAVSPERFTLYVPDAGAATWTYVFPCPWCTKENGGELSARAGSVLISAGARVAAIPTTYDTAVSRQTRSALSPDDLIDFHKSLQTDAWWSEFLRTVSRTTSDGESTSRDNNPTT